MLLPESKSRKINLPILVCAIVLGLWVGSYLVMRTVWTMEPKATNRGTKSVQRTRLVMLPLSGDVGLVAAKTANILYYPLCVLDAGLSQERTLFSYRWNVAR